MKSSSGFLECKDKNEMRKDARDDDGMMPKPFNVASSTSTSSDFHPSNFAFTSSPSHSVLLYKMILEEELKESRRSNKSFFWGLLLLVVSSFAAAARPDLVPAAFLLFALTALPARAVGFARRRWGFFMLDFCYFANAAVAAWLLLEGGGEAEKNTEDGTRNLRAAVVALAEGPLAAAALAWRCGWCPGMPLSHLISTLVHVLPGAALFAREVTAAAAAAAAAGKQQQQQRPFFGGRRAKEEAEQRQQQNSLLWSFRYQFLAPLLFYLVWQLLYFCVVQVVCRDSILRNRHDTSYRCLARRAARADNFWNLLVRGREPCEARPGALRPSPSSREVDERRGLRRGTTAAARCLRYGGVQLAFTASTLAAAAVVTGNGKLWGCWQVMKFAAPLWYGVEAAAKARRRAAERRVERAVAEAAAAAAAAVNNKN